MEDAAAAFYKRKGFGMYPGTQQDVRFAESAESAIKQDFMALGLPTGNLQGYVLEMVGISSFESSSRLPS